MRAFYTVRWETQQGKTKTILCCNPSVNQSSYFPNLISQHISKTLGLHHNLPVSELSTQDSSNLHINISMALLPSTMSFSSVYPEPNYIQRSNFKATSSSKFTLTLSTKILSCKWKHTEFILIKHTATAFLVTFLISLQLFKWSRTCKKEHHFWTKQTS